MDHTDVMKNDHLLHRDCTIIDQHERRVEGMLPNSRGKEDPEKCEVKAQCLLIMRLV